MILNKKTALSLAALAGLGLLITGCQSLERARLASTEANPAPCPNVIVLQDAGRMIQFAGDPALENIAYTAEITNVETNCRYFTDEPIEAEVEIDFAVGRGPMGSDSAIDLEYFVAVTRTDRDLIAKEEFSIPVRFSRNRDTVTLNDRIGNITIPRRDDNTSGVNFEIVVGLALSREQVLYNRSGQSLKFPDLD